MYIQYPSDTRYKENTFSDALNAFHVNAFGDAFKRVLNLIKTCLSLRLNAFVNAFSHEFIKCL